MRQPASRRLTGLLSLALIAGLIFLAVRVASGTGRPSSRAPAPPCMEQPLDSTDIDPDGITLNPPESGDQPAKTPEDACNAAWSRLLQEGTPKSAVIELGRMVVTQGEPETEPAGMLVYRVTYGGLCLAPLSEKLQPSPKQREQTCFANNKYAVVIDANTGKFVLAYTSEHLG